MLHDFSCYVDTWAPRARRPVIGRPHLMRCQMLHILVKPVPLAMYMWPTGQLMFYCRQFVYVLYTTLGHDDGSNGASDRICCGR